MMVCKPSILIVDDQLDNQKFLVNLLKPDYRVLIAADGIVALDLLRTPPEPDLILLDIMMPIMDGYETCQRIKQQPRLAQIPIIFLTAKIDTDSETRSFELGAVDYVSKPINPPVLRARIRAQLALATQMRRACAERDRSQQLVAQVSSERDAIETLAQQLQAEIAEHERTELALRASQARFERLTQTLKDRLLFFSRTLEGELLYLSEGANSFGIGPAEQAIGCIWPNLLPALIPNLDAVVMSEHLNATTNIVQYELTYRPSDGRQRHLLIHEYRVQDHIQRRELIEGLALDVTEQWALEQVKEDVQRIMRHDLKGPLNAMIALPSLILNDDSLSQKSRKYVGMIEESGRQMYDMIELSLDLFKMETGHYHYFAQSIDILVVLQRLQQFAEVRLRDKTLTVQMRLDGRSCAESEELWATADDRLLFSLLSNLWINAIEASPDGATIELELQRQATTVELTLRNRGTVPEVIRDHFFEKYRTHGKRGGTGLGTYSAKLMADTMGLSLSMETSPLENWTCLRLTLPVLA
ncbi:PAS domain S-box-containing protein [Allochromatium warmingii]|uniref:histidine kinase n=1 Tax=Allochromatium warmingii TaxID=61595 RepID=A0A1H3G6T7_ALLWA|nr:response regulator [Allochromatium warmingii]SDX98996.1 PAS domain S-box-containing protein [Allochromatium warmingii]